ncbi:porin [Vibrio sp. SM6]|uniref:Porin n=1 Tax=Vibrio agarilyticus TaxID=2726741 RepID=A0A7X8TNT6_9VIBR|nr:porin [Vibrio agarilyticus]NLS11912.1 porin [Vibrio agarilyticus]
MKTNVCTLALLSTFSVYGVAQTLEAPKPQFYGEIQAQAAWHDYADYTTDIARAEVGLKGTVKAEAIAAHYTLELEYSESLTDASKDNDIIVREANIALVNKTYGGAFIGTGTTGTWKDLYSKVDIFDSNNMERHSDNLLFGGKRYGSNQLAVMTPKMNGFQFKAAMITPKEYNDNDADIIGLRALYSRNNFSFVVNHSFTAKEMNNAKEDAQRTVAATSYQWDQWYVGAVAEFDYDVPFGRRNVYALSTRYTLDDTKFSLGYQRADWFGHQENESLWIANVNHALNDHFAIYGEAAFYGDSDKTKATTPQLKAKGNNYNLGLIVSF